LAEYDFILNYQLEVQNNKVDHLSWRLDHGRGVENNNSDQILLKPEYFFIKATRRGQSPRIIT
jgi:hypothetical protein